MIGSYSCFSFTEVASTRVLVTVDQAFLVVDSLSLIFSEAYLI